MTEKLNLRQKLAKIRESIEYLQKDTQGNQGAKYVDPAALLKKIRAGMNEQGVVLSTSISEAKMSIIHQPTKTNKENHDHLCCLSMMMTWLDTDSDETILVPWFATGSHMQDPAMAMGGALTYSERYFFLKYFNIPTSKDDPELFEKKTKELPPPVKISEKLLSTCVDMINEKFNDPKPFTGWLCNSLGINELASINTNQFEQAMMEIDRAGTDKNE